MNIPNKAPRAAQEFFMNIRKDLMKIVEQIDNIVYDCDADELPNIDVLHRRLIDKDINPRVINALKRNGLFTVGELAGCTEERLQKIPGLGASGLEACIKYAASIGFPVGHPHLRGWHRDPTYIPEEYKKTPIHAFSAPSAFTRRYFGSAEFLHYQQMADIMSLSLADIKKAKAFDNSSTPELMREWLASELGFSMRLE